MREETANKILEQTPATYNKISQDWNRTRQNLWSGLKDFLPYLKQGDKVLDVGCGNGRLVKLFKDVNVVYTGVDNSQELLKIARVSFPNQSFVTGDILNLPFADNSFDAISCIAAWHHIPGKELRRRALDEIKRVIKPGGIIFMMNWHYSSSKLFPLLLKFTLAKLAGKSELDFGDIYIKFGTPDVKRFYHLFSKPGIKKEFKRAELKVLKNYTSEYSKRKFRNIITIARLP